MNILTCTPKTLTDAEEKTLRDWLASKERDKLIKIVESRVKEQLAQASNKAMDISPTNGYADQADAFLRKAHRYQAFLDVLKELVEQKDGFSVIVLN